MSCAMDRICIILVSVLTICERLCESANVNRFPTARIVIHVSKRRAEYWEPWEINRRICPPSLCQSSDSGGGEEGFYKPRGTAGTPFYQGDIVLHREDERFIYPEAEPKRRKRATMRFRNKLWKNGVVVYKLDRKLSKAAENVIVRAIKQIEAKTCIKFRKKKQKDKDFILYISEPGCWSNVGKRGGLQKVSIGRGCENTGTAIHETSHSLGVWHEQARPDRDTYIEVIEENISPRFLPDFKKLSKKITTSRGFPYDYSSVMHYNKHAFTRMGEPTIKVIGIGKKLKLKIGQRRGLSSIDVAQLRAMYRCNQKEDARDTFCPKRWVKFQTSCYQFHDQPKRQFSAAFKHCASQRALLINVETGSEERFIGKYLNKKFPLVDIWRTGGRRINGTMMWFKGDKSKPIKMKYSHWAPGMPGTYTSMALVKDESSGKFLWKGVWTGSAHQLPDFTHAFICEKRARRKCIKGAFRNGRDYRGKLDHTIRGITCQKWSEQYPHSHKHKPESSGNKEDAEGLGKHSYCRNPGGSRRKPWCYTTKTKKEWQYCDVTICSEKKHENKVTRGSNSTSTKPIAQSQKPNQRSKANRRSRYSQRERTVQRPYTPKEEVRQRRNRRKRRRIV